MVIQGCTSAYAIWSQLKQESKDSGNEKEIIAYKNVNVRLGKLVKLGYITEVAPHTYTQHGRRDYKVTMKSFELLRPYIMGHPEEIQSIVEYLKKFDIDKYQFGLLLLKGHTKSTETLNEYHKRTNALYYPFGITRINEIKEWLSKYKDGFDEDDKELKNKLSIVTGQMSEDINDVTNTLKELVKLRDVGVEMSQYMHLAKKDGDRLTEQFNAEEAEREIRRKKKPTR